MQLYRREWRMAKATPSSQMARQRIHHRNRNMGSLISNMEDSLQRIKQKQTDFVDAMAAREEVEDSLADVVPNSRACAKLSIESVESVLARIKQKKNVSG